MINNPKKILIIRRDNIGDLVCTTPAIAALRKQYPKAEIGALVNSYNAEVLRDNPNVDQLFVYQKLKHASGLDGRTRALVRRLGLIFQLQYWRPDITILAKASYDRHGLNFARQIGAKNIIGYVPEVSCDPKALPDIRLETPEFTSVHEVEAVVGLLKPLGITEPIGPLKVFPDAILSKTVAQKLPEARCRIALHISAREFERRWGIDNFISLTKHIIQTQPETQILLFWSPGTEDNLQHPGDDQAAEQLIKAVTSDRLIPLPTQNLTELVAALSLCQLFIGTDGGALHLAAGLNKPCLALFENLPAKLSHWYPWGVPCRVVHGVRPEVASIEMVAVQNALADLMLETDN